MKWEKNPDFYGITLKERTNKIFGTYTPDKDHTLEEYKIPLMKKAAQMIKSAVANKDFVQVVGDYDCDGIGSSYGMTEILRSMEHPNFDVRIPRRLSEGYGMNDTILNEILKKPMGLCVFVDNGITASEYIRVLKDYGWETLILDHHELPEGLELPEADCLIDPEAVDSPEQGTFKHYCGAGLVYKLAEELCEEGRINRIKLNKILAMSAVSTVADIVPFVDKEHGTYANWLLVRKGLKNLTNKDFRTQGLYSLLNALNLDYHINETDLGFSVAPCINAVGRLEDDGAMRALNLICQDGNEISKYHDMALELVALNNARKSAQKEAIAKIAKGDVSIEHNVFVVYAPELKEGLLGLVAADFVKKYKVSCIVLSDTSEDGLIKGSSRAYEDYDIMSLLNKAKDLMYKYGGHEGAAGVTLNAKPGQTNAEAVAEFKAKIEAMSGDYVEPEISIKYDEVVEEFDLNDGLKTELNMLAPFGKGNPAPVYLLDSAKLTPKRGDYYKLMGATQSAIRLNLSTIQAVNFTGEGKDRYLELGEPKSVKLIGTVSENWWLGKCTLQFSFKDIQTA